MKRQLIIDYDDKKQEVIKRESINGDIVICLQSLYKICASCGGKVTIENWGGHILKRKYRNRSNVVIYKQDQKDFVCNKCLNPTTRKMMRVLGLTNRK